MLLLLMSNSGFGQETRKNSFKKSPPQQGTGLKKTLRKKIQPKFSVQMSRGASSFKWCKTYFKSFRKTKEIDYLMLAGRYCQGAIQIYFQTQKNQSKKTPFYYQAKSVKVSVCGYYRSMRSYSLQRKKPEQLPEINSNYCSN